MAVHLTSMARIQLPSALSDKTKRKLLKLSPEEIGWVLNPTIGSVKKFSVEQIDTLVKRYLCSIQVAF